jgi:sugar phosphate isomerase/epimerase
MRPTVVTPSRVLGTDDLATDADRASLAGASALGLFVEQIEPIGVVTARHLLARAGLGVSALGGLWQTLAPVDERAVSHVRDVVAMAAGLGTSAVMVTTGPLGDVDRPEADRRTKAWFAEMAPIADAHGVRLLLEPVHPLLSWATYVHTLGHATDLTGGRNGAGLLLDVGHVWTQPDLIDDLDQFIDWVGLVQLDDVDGDALARHRYQRVAFGDGVVPVTELVLALDAAGYRGFYENEIVLQMPEHERVPFVRAGKDWLSQVLPDNT